MPRITPKDVDEIYARILHSIPFEYKQNATRILQFLTYPERPLRIEEAVDAIAVDTKGDQYFDPNYKMPDPREISHYCSSLVVVVSAKDHLHDKGDKPMELRLAHFSVKEYLTLNWLQDIAQNFQKLAARASIATVCLAYLLHLNQNILIEKIQKTFPLAQYPARYWMDYAAIAESKDRRLQGFVEKLFCHHENSYRNCYSLYQPDGPWDDEENLAPALYYASFGGLVNAVQYILSQGADVNAQGGLYSYALQAASHQGHEKIVELLLAKGADVNAQGAFYGTALYAALAQDNKAIVKLLVEAGADVNVQDNNFDNYGGEEYSTALHTALANGDEATVKLFIEAGADLNAQGYFYDDGGDTDHGTALYAASSKGYKAIIKLLVEAGADVNAQGGWLGHALQAASFRGYKEVVKLLLAKGANVNAQGGNYGHALQAASVQGHEKIVKLLLKDGAVL